MGGRCQGSKLCVASVSMKGALVRFRLSTGSKRASCITRGGSAVVGGGGTTTGAMGVRLVSTSEANIHIGLMFGAAGRASSPLAVCTGMDDSSQGSVILSARVPRRATCCICKRNKLSNVCASPTGTMLHTSALKNMILGHARRCM